MRIKSYIEQKNGIVPVEVELTLWPGLPRIQFLGLPDQQIRESALRIKSALKAQGFHFPRSKQILVNLRPNYIKKSSRGLELAVALAYLWETQQIQLPKDFTHISVYGELDLSGAVYAPRDLDVCALQGKIVTGVLESALHGPTEICIVRSLADFKTQLHFKKLLSEPKLQPPELPDYYFSQEQAELISLMALGNHPTLIAGSAGVGKTTLAKVMSACLQPPRSDELAEIQKLNPGLYWRPLIKPHHSTSTSSMIGGGNQLFAGEIARAHRGVLLLDELLQFDGKVFEALREPMEEKRIRIHRNGSVAEYACDALVIATTNLCPCGKWNPLDEQVRCSFSRLRCHSIRQRLSGPFLDRFDILSLQFAKQEGKISLHEIKQKLAEARKIQSSPIQFEKWAVFLPSGFTSHRRVRATLSVACQLARLNGEENLSLRSINKALEYTYYPFRRLIP